MKKTLIAIVFILGGLSCSFGQQTNPNKRPKQVKFKPKLNKFEIQSVHFPGANGMDIFIYKGEKTTVAGANYIHYILDGLALKGGLSYEKGNPFQIPYQAWYFKIIPQYSVVSIKEKFYVNINAGGVMVYDEYQAYEPLDSKINFGGLLGIELEYTLGRFALLANVEQQYVQTARSFVGGGLRYFFN